MTQCIRPNLFTAIYLSLACSIVLNDFIGFHAREAILTALPSAVFLICSIQLLIKYSPYFDSKAVAAAMIAMLLFAATYEILALWQLYLAAYNGTVVISFVAAAVLLPTLYLRDKTALGQSSNFVLIILALAMLMMLISVSSQMRVTNLSTDAGNIAMLSRSGAYELTIVPELLIAALFIITDAPEKKGNPVVVKSILLLCLGRVAICLLLELFYGNAVMWRSNAFHTATASGTISMFKRMEWFQLLLWTMAVSVKVALFFFAAWVIRYKRGVQTIHDRKSAIVPMESCIVMELFVAILVALLKNIDIEILQLLLTAAVWAVWLLITMGGFLRCTLSKKKSGA